MAVTVEQQTIIDEITTNFNALMVALTEALETDNDRSTSLTAAAEKRAALREAANVFSQHNLTGYIRTASDPPVFLLRDGGTDHQVDGIIVNDPTYMVPRF